MQKNRLLYSLRQTRSIETAENTNTTLDDIASLRNTLTKMLNTRYLKQYQKKAVQMQDLIYSK